MKRCSFLLSFALIILLVMPVKVSAAESVLPARANYLRFADGNAQLTSYYKEPGVIGGPEHFGEQPLYFIICEDGFYIACYMPFSVYSSDVYIDYLDYKVDRGYSYLYLNKVTTNKDFFTANGITWNSAKFVAWGSQFGFNKTPTYAPNSYFYTANNEEELISLFDQENSAGTFYKLYGLEQDYSEAVDFFQKPPVTGVLEKNLKTTLLTMEVDPLTEVVKILPIGLVCLVGWIGLRKGLSLLRQVLFPA